MYVLMGQAHSAVAEIGPEQGGESALHKTASFLQQNQTKKTGKRKSPGVILCITEGRVNTNRRENTAASYAGQRKPCP